MAKNKWPILACQWEPNMIVDPQSTTRPKRNQGHPLLRWDDSVNIFCQEIFDTDWQEAPVNDWMQYKHEYSRYCNYFD